MRRELILALILLVALPLAMLLAEESAEAPGPLLGDQSDGSRAHPTHVIPLFPSDEAFEKGPQIALDDDPLMPFSTKFTCGECHSYNVIEHGWHFNAMDPNAPAGRPGEPWVYSNTRLGIQLPMSYRAWPGAIDPNAVGFTPFEFTEYFGRHMPGGGPGEVDATEVDDIGRQYVCGKLEINCLACHNGHYGQDQGGVDGYAVNVSSNQNFRWAAAASCEFASVKGSAKAMTDAFDPFMPEGDEKEPHVIYDENAFDDDGNVLFDIVREVPNARCYFCHSDLYQTEEDGKTEKWTCDEDIHLKAGLKCVDCHRNGIGHNIGRGFPGETGNPTVATATCKGCHVPEGSEIPEAGRFGAPVPVHVGLPTVHFERLTCTACHSGPWPGAQTILTKTSRAHRLGTPSVNKAVEVVPHIVSPVYAEVDEQIGPYKMIWPAYWATRSGDEITPVEIDTVKDAIGDIFEELKLPDNGDWPGITEVQIAQALGALSTAVDANAVYVAGGTVYSLVDANSVAEEAGHPAAQPYKWAIAHNVRPAAQSLGIRYCTDCHATDSPMFFASVVVDSPVASEAPVTTEMVSFQNISPFYAWAFSASFVFRPWFKIVALGASGIIGIVLLLYGLRALGAAAKVLSEDE